MSGIREKKQCLSQWLASPEWRGHLNEIADAGALSVNALFALLPRETLVRHRAAVGLGAVCARMAETSIERAREIVRRYMWHMNEESGNIGWGIPEAFAETLVASPALAQEFYRVFISYVISLNKDDNFCDHAILRRSCYWGIGRFAGARPDLGEYARPWLLKGLTDEDAQCRGLAAWAIGQLPASLMDGPALRRLAQSGQQETCEVFDGEGFMVKGVSQLAHEALVATK